jgi:hypothetical protein
LGMVRRRLWAREALGLQDRYRRPGVGPRGLLHVHGIGRGAAGRRPR